MKRLLIINSAEPGITEFIEPLMNIACRMKIDYTAIQYAETHSIEWFQYHGVIISGSPRGNDIVEHHLPYFEWIKASTVPIFGICAGHHITGFLYGSELLRSVEKEVGDFEVIIDRNDPIFYRMNDRFLARQNHHDSITLPSDFILLAHTQRCKVSMMKHSEKPVYSTQFHPEILNPLLIENFFRLIKT